MTLVVPIISASLDQISDLAKHSNGWVVSADRSSIHHGSIAIRIPSDQLEDVIVSLRDIAESVESEVSSSQDVTDEYVDVKSRLTNQQATEDALLRLLTRAETVEEALSVQKELTKVQQEIELLKGRIKLLEETSAFSLISVHLKLTPSHMPIDAGVDQTVSIRIPAQFRATFEPPEAIDEFGFTWDFGDGSEPVFSDRTAPTIHDGKRVTATITHFYSDVKNSPYIVEIEMTGTGENGVTEGNDILMVTVTDIPAVEVFAGEGITATQGEEVEFAGSFTRPENLTAVNYEWDFGDGTAPDIGVVSEGVTKITTTHIYKDYRPFPYQAFLTISAESEVGEVEVESQVTVTIHKKPRWMVDGWDAKDIGRTAVRSLSGVAAIVVTMVIWVVIFSPLWIVLGGLAYIAQRLWKKRSRDGHITRPYDSND